MAFFPLSGVNSSAIPATGGTGVSILDDEDGNTPDLQTIGYTFVLQQVSMTESAGTATVVYIYDQTSTGTLAAANLKYTLYVSATGTTSSPLFRRGQGPRFYTGVVAVKVTAGATIAIAAVSTEGYLE